MLGTSEERRYMGPAGSQTQHHHSSQPHSNSQQASAVPHFASHPATAFPSFFSPYSHFQHLAALHTTFGGSNLNTTDLILNQTSAHTTSLWPGSPTLSSTTNGQLPQTPSSAACSGRVSAFDFYTNGQGEFSHFPFHYLAHCYFFLLLFFSRSPFIFALSPSILITVILLIELSLGNGQSENSLWALIFDKCPL